ncbi:MAG TPA: hypothetical protein VE173_03915 [Longimicrobiales bacterium]|nr:hypothetical protein [Longimicrobiales bacterium]
MTALGAFLDAPGSESEFDLVYDFVTAPGVPGAIAFRELENRGPDSIGYRPPVRESLRREVEVGGFQSEETRTLAEAVARENGWKFGGEGQGAPETATRRPWCPSPAGSPSASPNAT